MERQEHKDSSSRGGGWTLWVLFLGLGGLLALGALARLAGPAGFLRESKGSSLQAREITRSLLPASRRVTPRRVRPSVSPSSRPGVRLPASKATNPTLQASPTSRVATQEPFHKGMTVSCFGWGAAWGTPRMKRTMKELKRLGVNWVSYHPYAWIRWDDSLGYRLGMRQPHVVQPLIYGKQIGVKMLLKPHIGYWGSRFSWRGAITFSEEKAWKRFFRDYTTWIVDQARIAQRYKAEMFSVGVEYRKTLHREKDWRAVIAAVRRVYKGKLTYSANWDTYQKVPFWDALDLIGIQAYFPISKAKDPSPSQIRAGWKPILKTLAAFSAKHRKKILFTELGYNYASHTLARPWDHQEGGPKAGAIKLRAVKISLQVLQGLPWLQGVFLWKWFPSRRLIESNYTLQYPAMKSALCRVWKGSRCSSL